MHYKVKETCNIKGVTYQAGQIIIEGDAPRDLLLPGIIAGTIEQIGVIDTSPPVPPVPPVIPEPTPETPTDGDDDQ